MNHKHLFFFKILFVVQKLLPYYPCFSLFHIQRSLQDILAGQLTLVPSLTNIPPCMPFSQPKFCPAYKFFGQNLAVFFLPIYSSLGYKLFLKYFVSLFLFSCWELFSSLLFLFLFFFLQLFSPYSFSKLCFPDLCH